MSGLQEKILFKMIREEYFLNAFEWFTGEDANNLEVNIYNSNCYLIFNLFVIC